MTSVTFILDGKCQSRNTLMSAMLRAMLLLRVEIGNKECTFPLTCDLRPVSFFIHVSLWAPYHTWNIICVSRSSCLLPVVNRQCAMCLQKTARRSSLYEDSFIHSLLSGPCGGDLKTSAHCLTGKYRDDLVLFRMYVVYFTASSWMDSKRKWKEPCRMRVWEY